MSTEFEEFAAEADITAVAVAAGVMKGVPVEKSAAERWAEPIPGHEPYDDRKVSEIRRLDRAVWGDPYPPVTLTAEQARDLANELVAEHGFDPQYLARRYGLTPRRTA